MQLWGVVQLQTQSSLVAPEFARHMCRLACMYAIIHPPLPPVRTSCPPSAPSLTNQCFTITLPQPHLPYVCLLASLYAVLHPLLPPIWPSCLHLTPPPHPPPPRPPDNPCCHPSLPIPTHRMCAALHACMLSATLPGPKNTQSSPTSLTLHLPLKVAALHACTPPLPPLPNPNQHVTVPHAPSPYFTRFACLYAVLHPTHVHNAQRCPPFDPLMPPILLFSPKVHNPLCNSPYVGLFACLYAVLHSAGVHNAQSCHQHQHLSVTVGGYTRHELNT